MALNVILLLLDAGNYAYGALTWLFGSTPERWNYVLQGASNMVLFLLVSLVAPGWIGRGLCVFGCWDGFLTAGCGALRLRAPAGEFKLPGHENVCQSALGLTILETAGLGILFAFAVTIAIEQMRKKNHEPPAS